MNIIAGMVLSTIYLSMLILWVYIVRASFNRINESHKVNKIVIPSDDELEDIIMKLYNKLNE